MSLISVCIPAYNAAKYIGETLQSVKEQTYKNWEIIIVEDGSKDDTEDIVNKFRQQVSQDIIYFFQKDNCGLSATRNVCVNLSKGKWIALLDSDDIWKPNHLADLMRTVAMHSECELAHSEVVVFDSQTGNTLPSIFLPQEAIRDLPLSLFDGRYSIQPSAAMISANLYKSVGGFDSALRCCEDKEMWFRCVRFGSGIAFTGNVSCSYRKHAESLSAQSEKISIAMAQVYSKHDDWESIPKNIRMKHISSAWFSAARIVRKQNKGLAKEYLLNSMKYTTSFKQICFWLLLLAK